MVPSLDHADLMLPIFHISVSVAQSRLHTMHLREPMLLTSSSSSAERTLAADVGPCLGFLATSGAALGSLQQLDAEQWRSVAAATPAALTLQGSLPGGEVALSALPGD